MKYRFASSEWFAALHGVLVQKAAIQAATNPKNTFSMCEVYLNVPAALSNAPHRLAWSCVIEGSKVDFQTVERSDTSVKVEVDFAVCEAVARFDTRGDPVRAVELAAMTAAARQSGKLTVLGALSPVAPDETGSVHDIMARMTS